MTNGLRLVLPLATGVLSDEATRQQESGTRLGGRR